MADPDEPEPKEGMNRRSFLGWIIASLGAIIAATIGGSGIGYFISPIFKRKQEGWLDIGYIEDLSPGIPNKVEFVQRKRDAWATTEHRSLAWVLLNSDRKTLTAFDPRCTHLGCPYRWDEKVKQFLCPCHSAAFSIDGAVIKGPPPRPLDRYPVKIVDGRVFIQAMPLRKEKVDGPL